MVLEHSLTGLDTARLTRNMNDLSSRLCSAPFEQWVDVLQQDSGNYAIAIVALEAVINST